MELKNKPCIISAGIGGHYSFGIDRLEKNLMYHGWPGSTMFWKDYPKGCPRHIGDGQYNFKVFCFNEAFKAGHKVVIWVDSSIYPIKDIMPIFDYVNDKGLFFFKSGYPLSATATDRLLSYIGCKREELVDVPEFATGVVGINIDNPLGAHFFASWERMMHAGLFGGDRVHNEEDSKHPLFKFSRQDQSAASAALYEMGITSCGEDKDWVSYYPNVTDKTILFIKGI